MEEMEGRVPAGFGREFDYRKPVKSFYETSVEAAFHPYAFYSRIPRVGDYLTPTLFVAVCSFISYILSGLYYHLYLDFEPRTYALSVFFSPLMNILFAFLAACVIHPFVRLTQGLGNAGFEATYRVMCYSSVVLLLDWAFTGGPGLILYLFLTFFLIVVGLRQVHQTTGATAAFLTLFPWLPALVIMSVVWSAVLQMGGEEFMRNAERVLELIGIL